MNSLGALLFALWIAAQILAVIYLRTYADGEHVPRKEREAPDDHIAQSISA